jgi:hypothetical protein
VQSYVTPHIEGKRYTNIGGSWAATIFSVVFHFFFYSVWGVYFLTNFDWFNIARNLKNKKKSELKQIFYPLSKAHKYNFISNIKYKNQSKLVKK